MAFGTEARPAAARKAPPGAAKTDPHAPFRLRFREIYLNEVRPFLEGRPDRRLESQESSARQFDDWRARLPAKYHSALQDLKHACELCCEMKRQERLHSWLHTWLMVHIPASIALLVLLVIHVFTALRVVPF
jgi:hypothetical protein